MSGFLTRDENCFPNHQLVMTKLCMNYTFKNQILGQSDFCNNNSALLRQSFSVSRLFKTMCNTLSVSQIHYFKIVATVGFWESGHPSNYCGAVCTRVQMHPVNWLWINLSLSHSLFPLSLSLSHPSNYRGAVCTWSSVYSQLQMQEGVKAKSNGRGLIFHFHFLTAYFPFHIFQI